jgi:hypothetical protein
MKLYYFNPNNYGQQYFVLAEDKTKAHEYLIEYFREKIDETNDKYEKRMYRDEQDMWKKVDPLDAKTFPGGYTLDEHDAGDVISSEIS